MRKLSSFDEAFLNGNADKSEQLFSDFYLWLVARVVDVPKDPVEVHTSGKIVHIVDTQRPIYDALHCKYYQQPLLQIMILRLSLPNLSENFGCSVQMIDHWADQVNVNKMSEF